MPHQPALPKDPEPMETKKQPAVLSKPEPKPDSEPKMPPHWRTAKDGDGKVYFYHAITRETQWDPPSLEDTSSKTMETPASPTQPKKQPKKKKEFTEISFSPPKKVQQEPVRSKPAAAKPDPEAGMDAESRRQLNEFKSQLAKVVVNILGRYNKVDCKVGRIMENNDFKYLARKLTHGLTEKEMQRKQLQELCVTDSLKQRVKLYITSYMGKFGPIYHRT